MNFDDEERLEKADHAAAVIMMAGFGAMLALLCVAALVLT